MKAVIVTYVVKRGREKEFEKVLRKHWKVLKSEGLSTDQLPFLLRDPESPSVYKEIFEWKSKRSFQKAHESQKVQQIWRRLMELTQDGGMEPANFQRI
jgi:heme-degrading monooxygenase HmoA